MVIVMKKILFSLLSLVLLCSLIYAEKTEIAGKDVPEESRVSQEEIALMKEIVKNFDPGTEFFDFRFSKTDPAVKVYDEMADNRCVAMKETDKELIVYVADLVHKIVTDYINPSVMTVQGKIVLSEDECFEAALSYLNSKGPYLLFYDTDYEEKGKASESDYYEFTFYPKKLKETEKAFSGQKIKVRVSSVTGQIWTFSHICEPIYIMETEPGLTYNRAEKTIRGLFAGEETEGYDIYVNMYDKSGFISIDIPGYKYEGTDEDRTCFDKGRPVVWGRLSLVKQTENSTESFETEFEFDGYTGALLYCDFTENDKIKMPGIKEKIKEYTDKVKAGPKLEKTIPFEAPTAEGAKKLTPGDRDIELILYTDTKPVMGDVKDIDINLFENNSALMTFSCEKDGKRYIFRQGSHWCLCDNMPVDMEGTCFANSKKVFLPKKFAEKFGF